MGPSGIVSSKFVLSGQTQLAWSPTASKGLAILRVKFYIELLQISRNMMNGNNQPYRLTNWLGDADLLAIPAANFACNVLANTLQDERDLMCPDFSLTSAKTDKQHQSGNQLQNYPPHLSLSP